MIHDYADRRNSSKTEVVKRVPHTRAFHLSQKMIGVTALAMAVAGIIDRLIG